MRVNLDQAVAAHQRGHLDEAARTYKLILQQDPGHADALHLLGLVALQQGDAARAIELISRALAREPGRAAFHANLAEAYRVLRRYSEAAAHCREALRLRPEFAVAANNLGLCLQALGQVEAAADQFCAAVRLQANFAIAHNNLGVALRDLGQPLRAMEHFEQAIRYDARLAEAYSNIAQLLLAQHRYAEALAHCQTALRIRPDLYDARLNAGVALDELGRRDEAKDCYAAVIRQKPDLAIAYNNMGKIVQSESKLVESLAWFERSLELQEAGPVVHCNLGVSLLELRRHEEAAIHFERALQIDPKSSEAYNGMGQVWRARGDEREAECCFRAALRLREDFSLAHCNLGIALEEAGDFEGAMRSFRAAVHHDRRCVSAHYRMASALGGALPEADLDAMRQLVSASGLADTDRAILHFGIARVFDARGRFPEAAEHMRLANVLTKIEARRRDRSYDREGHERMVDALIDTCTPRFFERVRDFGVETQRPVFIIGLPRSGTTLTEQILARHSTVFGAGELTLVRDLFESLPQRMNSRASEVECLGQLDQDTAQRIAAEHLTKLDVLDPKARHIVDKMPENYLYLGLLAALYPRATFIHCQRDLRDIAVSCWMTPFLDVRWASDLDDMASRFRAYKRLMDHWRRVLPIRWLDVVYEETVADLEQSARRLVAHCGLDWQPTCLTFHEGRMPVRSASFAQVRRPIYSHAVGRWKNYEQALSPLLRQLEESVL